MPPVLQYLHALARWALEWIRMDLALARIWALQHPAETAIALLVIALLFAILACLPTCESQEGQR